MPRSKPKFRYMCQICGNDSPKWEGHCSACGEWNSVVEAPLESGVLQSFRLTDTPIPIAEELSQVSVSETHRLILSSPEINRVLGGGIESGSVILIAGEPGIGKSTLLLKLIADVAKDSEPTLYVSGEESINQVRLRADRLGISGDKVYLLQATALQHIVDYLDDHCPSFVVVDSIQTIHDNNISSVPGSVTQIKECTRVLTQWAKRKNVSVILTGHVTKGGEIAGPRVLEHIVDVVLCLEGDPMSSWRLLRATKNRFGSTNEVGVFEMNTQGLIDVPDPSRGLVSKRRESIPGSIIVATIEGTRPLLSEIQALTNLSVLPVPRRVTTGSDLNRLLLVCAVLSRQSGITLSNQDVAVNVTGGLRINEPAVDLGIALAIASSYKNISLPANLAAIGEIGLTGEVRSVPQLNRRVAEVTRLGLRTCLVPEDMLIKQNELEDIEFIQVKTLNQALAASLGKAKSP